MPDTTDRATGSQPDQQGREKADKVNRVDEAGEETFPASDAPSFSTGTASPSDAEDTEREPGHLDRDEDGDQKNDA